MLLIGTIMVIASYVTYYVGYLKGKKSFKNQVSMYESGLETGVNSIQELCMYISNIISMEILDVSVISNNKVWVQGINFEHVFYIENGRIKYEYPNISVGFSRGEDKMKKEMKIFKNLKKVIEANKIMDSIQSKQSGNHVQNYYDDALAGEKIFWSSFPLATIGAILMMVGCSSEV